MRGSYNPDVLIELPPGSGMRVVVPLVDCNGGQATAIYNFKERRKSSNTWLWKLQRIDEWCPPAPPQERARQFSDDAELPPLDPDGRTDWKAIAKRREREWREWEETTAKARTVFAGFVIKGAER